MRGKITESETFRSMVRSPGTYRILRPFLDILTMTEKNQAFRIWVRFILDITAKAYARRGPVIWMNVFSPLELCYGFGGIPFLPEIISAIVTYLNQSKGYIEKSAEGLSTDLCSFYRCVYGLIAEGFLPEPDLIISSSHVCDGANKFFNLMANKYKCPHLFLDIPYRDGKSERRYLREQLSDLIHDGEKLLRRRFSMRRLSRAILYSARARTFMKEANRLRTIGPAPISGSEGCSYIAGMNFYSPGTRWGEKFFRALCDYLVGMVSSGRGYLKRERYRVLWLHQIRPYYNNDIFETLSNRGVSVCFEEPNFIYWRPPDHERPIDSIVDKLLLNPWAGPIQRRIDAVEKMIEDYRVDGVIHFSHWGCRQSCGGAPIIGDWLKERGIPYLILHGDGADPSSYSPGQTRTRLEAFVEMLER